MDLAPRIFVLFYTPVGVYIGNWDVKNWKSHIFKLAKQFTYLFSDNCYVRSNQFVQEQPIPVSVMGKTSKCWLKEHPCWVVYFFFIQFFTFLAVFLLTFSVHCAFLLCVTNNWMNWQSFLNACACRPCEDPLSVVNKCIESLEKLVNLKTSADRALYVGSIEKLQLAVCTEGETPLFCLPFLILFSL